MGARIHFESNTVTPDNDTTYNLESVQSGADVNINLIGSDATTDTVSLVAGSNVQLTDDGSNNITIDASSGGSFLSDNDRAFGESYISIHEAEVTSGGGGPAAEYHPNVASVNIAKLKSNNLLNSTSLIYNPTSSRTDELPLIKPSNTSLTFARASTATRVNENGLIELVATGIPRIDYSNNGFGKLLIEPQRTNNLLQSNQFDTTWLNQLGGTRIGGQTNTIATSDDAWKLTKDAASGRSIRQIIALGSNTYTYSAFLKSGTLTTAALRIDTSSGASIINVDLSLGTITTEAGVISSSVVDYGGGWYKYSMTINDTVTNVHVYAGIIADTDAGYIFCQRTQLEAGSYPTSYIPTAGATATRLADTSVTTGLTSIINSTEGVLYINAAATEDGRISINDGSALNRVFISFTTSTNSVRVIVSSNGPAQFDKTIILTDVTDFNKIAVKWKINDFAIWANGVEVATDTSGSAPIGLAVLEFNNAAGSSNFLGNCQNLMVFPSALTDDELETLTTL